MDLDLVQPQEGEYVVALYEFPHHPCRILDPQRCWAGGGDVRMSVIPLSANLGSTWNQSYTWNQGWTTGLCHAPAEKNWSQQEPLQDSNFLQTKLPLTTAGAAGIPSCSWCCFYLPTGASALLVPGSTGFLGLAKVSWNLLPYNPIDKILVTLYTGQINKSMHFSELLLTKRHIQAR